MTDEQKRLLKQELQRTACGWSPVVQTPPPSVQVPAGTSQAAPPGPKGPEKK